VETISESLAAFASDLRVDSIPEAVLAKAKLSILDGIGTALLSSRIERSRMTARAVHGIAPDGKGRVWGVGMSAPPPQAAILNGMLVEGLDYSDIHVGAGLHPTSVILPALMAYGEKMGSSGADVLASHVAGCETMIRLGLSAPGRFHARGFQPTSIIGVLGAALAVSKLMGLRAREMGEAVDIGTTLAFGSSLSVSVGAYFGGVDSGRAAESGLLAAAMAREGVTAIARDSIEGRFGFLETHAGPGGYDAVPVTRKLGDEWGVKGIFHKRYPTSYACTFMLDAALRLRRRVGVKASRIERVTFGDSAPNIALFSEPEEIKRRPLSIYDAKTSHYFLAALALTTGSVTADTLQMNLKDRGVLELSDRVGYAVDDRSHWIEVELKGGEVVRESQDALVPTPEAQVRKKYAENAHPVIGKEAASKVEAMVDGLEELADVGRLAALLVGRPAGRI
jgi:2-methylcitrate dehydratase PrpD